MIAAIIAIFCYTSVTAVYADQKPSSVTKSNKPVLLVMGDSLSAAYGMDEDKGWVALMQAQQPTVKVVNASISGETTSGGKARLPALLKQHQPKWVIVELGANDALRGQSLKATKSNLQKMVESSQQQGAEVALLGIRLPTNYGPAYDKLLQRTYQQVAKQYDLLFDPFFLETVALEPGMMQQDALHPNEEAQPKILQRLQPLIEQLLD